MLCNPFVCNQKFERNHSPTIHLWLIDKFEGLYNVNIPPKDLYYESTCIFKVQAGKANSPSLYIYIIIYNHLHTDKNHTTLYVERGKS